MLFVECTATINGRREYFFPETDSENVGKRTVIHDISAGQYGQIVRIIEANLEDGTCREVTEDIALDVINYLEDMPRGQELRDWLENVAPEAWREFCVSKFAQAAE